MDRVLKIIKKDPLFEFLALGIVLYGLVTIFTSSSSQQVQTKKEIIIPSSALNQYDINKTVALTLEEYKQVLLHESYFLELYKQDKKIQDILLKKIYFILLNSKKLKEPSEEELEQFFKLHKKEYIPFKNVSIAFFPLEKNDKNLYEEFNILALKPTFAKQYKNQTLQQIQSRCGKYVAYEIKNLISGLWSKPYLCQGKTYTIYLSNKIPKDLEVKFSDVESRVYQDYMQLQKIKILQDAYNKTKQYYKIKVQ